MKDDLCEVLSEKKRWARLFDLGRWAPEVRVGARFQIVFNQALDLDELEEAMLEDGSIQK